MGQGFGPADFSLLAYGGGGPGHAAGFSAPLSFKDVLIPSWAAAFSAFGCVCGDFAYRADQQIDHDLPTDLTDPGDVETLGRINGVWHGLRDRITAQFAKSGIAEDKIVFRPGVRMQYRGQLKDIEIAAPTAPIEDEQALRMLVDTFERTFGKVYADAARSPELGYFITLGIMTGAVAIERPLLPSEPISPDATPDTAQKSVRDVFVEDRWHATPIYDMDALDAGVHLRGPAVIEAPSTTLYVPPDRGARLDEHRIFHMSKNGDRS
jgi:N-methylhydantoinase A/acetone carboxylase beta subunit